MKVIRKYWKKMSNKRHVYCYSILKLMENKYSYHQAKELVLNSKILDYVEQYPELVFHASYDDWVEWILVRNNLI